MDAVNRPAYSSVSRKFEVWNELARFTQAVSGTAHGMDQLGRKTLLDLGAQAAQVRLDDIGTRIEVVVPHVLEQHRSRHHLTCVAHQIFEQPKFARLQRDLLA